MEMSGNRTFQVMVKKRVRLEGAELEEYQRKEKENRENKADKKYTSRTVCCLYSVRGGYVCV